MDISTATILMVGAIFALLVTGLPLAFITGLVAMAFTFGWFGEAALPLIITFDASRDLPKILILSQPFKSIEESIE